MFKRNAMGNTRAKLLAGAVLMTLGLPSPRPALAPTVGVGAGRVSQAGRKGCGRGPGLGNKAPKYGQPAHFPALVGSVATAFNNPDASSLDLSDVGLCRIFSGQVSDWSNLASSDFHTLP